MMDRGRRPASGARRAWLAGAALMCICFIALGAWQVQRLFWKLDLIARVEARVHASPAMAPAPAQWTLISAQADEYRHVRASGVWLDGLATRVQASTELGSGFWLLVPLCQADGTVVIVNRGFLPSKASDWQPAAPQKAANDGCAADAARAATATVTGLLRLSEPSGTVMRHNDAATSRWYSRDVAAIAAAHGLARTAPYFIDADAAATPVADGAPVGGLTVIAFRNSHLVYALTWFALAIMAAGACRLIMRERETHNDESPT